MDVGLRRRRRRLAAAPTSSFYRGDHYAPEWIGGARKPGAIHGDGDKHDGYERELECKRYRRGKRDGRNNYVCRLVQRAGGSAISRNGASHGDEPRRCDEIRHRCGNDHERHHAGVGTKSCERGTRRDAGISSNRYEQRASGDRGSLECFRRGVHKRLRSGGRERELHRAEDSSLASECNADGGKRGRSREASFRGGGDYQQFFAAACRTFERARERDGNDCCDADTRSGIESEHCAGMVAERPGLQRDFLRDIDRGDNAIGGRRCRRGFGDVHGTPCSAKPEHRDGDGHSTSRRNQKSASDAGDSDRKSVV